MDSERKVIYLVGSLNSGGLERFVTRVSVEAIKQSLFVPVVVCLSRKEGIFLSELERAGVQVIQAPQKWQRNIFSLIKLRKLLKQLNAKVVHSQVNFSLFQQWLATCITGARFMVTERNMYPLSGLARIRRVIQFYFLRIFGVHYSANSLHVAAHLSKMVFYPKRNIRVIPNGVTMPEFNADRRKYARTTLGFDDKDFVVGYVARFAAHKGQDYFIEVMNEVYSVMRDQLKICFIGDGPRRPQMESVAKNKILKNNLIFYGVVSNVELYYSAFDCLALFSTHEGMPNVVIEAMSFALPVVANPVGNVQELFEGDCGIINYSNDPHKSAVPFLQLAADKDLRERIGKNARKKIETLYSIQHTLHILCREYKIGS